MHCRTCKVKMVEQKRSFHKKRKWVCPSCGRAKMQSPRKRPGTRGRRVE